MVKSNPKLELFTIYIMNIIAQQISLGLLDYTTLGTSVSCSTGFKHDSALANCDHLMFMAKGPYVSS